MKIIKLGLICFLLSNSLATAVITMWFRGNSAESYKLPSRTRRFIPFDFLYPYKYLLLITVPKYAKNLSRKQYLLQIYAFRPPLRHCTEIVILFHRPCYCMPSHFSYKFYCMLILPFNRGKVKCKNPLSMAKKSCKLICYSFSGQKVASCKGMKAMKTSW